MKRGGAEILPYSEERHIPRSFQVVPLSGNSSDIVDVADWKEFVTLPCSSANVRAGRLAWYWV